MLEFPLHELPACVCQCHEGGELSSCVLACCWLSKGWTVLRLVRENSLTVSLFGKGADSQQVSVDGRKISLELPRHKLWGGGG